MTDRDSAVVARMIGASVIESLEADHQIEPLSEKERAKRDLSLVLGRHPREIYMGHVSENGSGQLVQRMSRQLMSLGMGLDDRDCVHGRRYLFAFPMLSGAIVDRERLKEFMICDEAGEAA